MRRLEIMSDMFDMFSFKSFLIASMILAKRKLNIQDFSKKHLIVLKYKDKTLRFKVKENDGVLAIMDAFNLGIYDNEICRNNKVIFDCGSHIGTSAVFFSITNPESKIYCFEPDKSSFKLLKENLKLNNINSEVYNYAISDKDGFVSFNSNLNASVSSRIKEGGNIKVKSKDIDTLMEELKIPQIDLLKLDIEGEEINVLEKLTNSKKIKNLTCEVHEQYYSASELKRIVEKRGFTIYPDKEKEKFNSLFASQ